MDVRIGVTNAPRELNIELPDDTDAASLKADVEAVLASDSGVLWLTDKNERQVAIPPPVLLTSRSAAKAAVASLRQHLISRGGG